jgi:hypothetical protein
MKRLFLEAILVFGLSVAPVTAADIYRFLDTVGDGSGSKNANGNYASAAEEFLIQPGEKEYFKIERMIIQVRDSGAFDAGRYGNNITLTNGIVVQKKDANGVVTNITDNMPIQINADWGRVCFDVSLLSFGTGDDSLVVRWIFSKNGAPIHLDGDKGEYLAVILNDDLSGLNGHYFYVGGQIGPFTDSHRNIEND